MPSPSSSTASLMFAYWLRAAKAASEAAAEFGAALLRRSTGTPGPKRCQCRIDADVTSIDRRSHCRAERTSDRPSKLSPSRSIDSMTVFRISRNGARPDRYTLPFGFVCCTPTRSLVSESKIHLMTVFGRRGDRPVIRPPMAACGSIANSYRPKPFTMPDRSSCS